MPRLPVTPAARLKGLTPADLLVGVSPVRLAVTLGASYGILFCLIAIFTPTPPDEQAGPIPWISPAVMIGLLAALMLRERRRTTGVALAGALLLWLDLVNPQPAGNSSSYALIAVPVLELYFTYLDRLRPAVAWGVAATAWGVAVEAMDSLVAGMTLQGIIPLTVVSGVAGWAVGLVMRRRRAAEAELVTLADRRRRERVGLARELHDSVARDLTIITMQSAVLRSTDRPDEQEVARAAIEETARSGLDALKRLLVVLRAEDAVDAPDLVRDLEAESLRAAFDEAARHLTMLGYQVTIGRVPEGLPRAAETTAVRVVREGTTNITKHAAPAALCDFAATVEGGMLVVRIVNDSRRATTPRVPSTRLGLESLAERVRLLGGRLTSGREDGRWVLEARIPVDAPLAGSLSPGA